MMFYAIIIDANGNGIGSHTYGEQPSGLPSNEVACTAEQAASPVAFVVQNGAVIAATPTLAVNAAAMLAAGIQVVSTSNAGLSGTYACDLLAITRIGNLLAAIAAGLPMPTPFIQWPDVNGAPHAFSIPAFKNLASAILDFEMQLFPIANGAPGTLPVLPVTIA